MCIAALWCGQAFWGEHVPGPWWPRQWMLSREIGLRPVESEEHVERTAGLEIGRTLATPRELVDDPSHFFSSAGDKALPCEVDRGLARVRDLFEWIDVDSRDEEGRRCREGRSGRACQPVGSSRERWLRR